MSQKIFFPVIDEILYDHPELITSPLCPYRADNPCFHWAAKIELTDESGTQTGEDLHFDHNMVLDDSMLDRSAVRQAEYQIGLRLA